MMKVAPRSGHHHHYYYYCYTLLCICVITVIYNSAVPSYISLWEHESWRPSGYAAVGGQPAWELMLAPLILRAENWQ